MIIYAEEFTKQFGRIPSDIQRLYRRQEAIFKENWRDTRLHVKKLAGEPLAFFSHHSELPSAFYFCRA